MKRQRFVVIALLAFGLTSLIFLNGSRHGSEISATASPLLLSQHPLPNDPAVQRWLRGEPRHWRDCLLQH